ncbi:hypothetical protein [Thermanaeromonas toyohensis]|uniref:hypothetical protein n=1 Tax=Thermanaeromonas toyohensis TaxID=161154 RepID=UPI00155F9DE7|nr:hypothetical protein [Thermanaeromonas toyohensis]
MDCWLKGLDNTVRASRWISNSNVFYEAPALGIASLAETLGEAAQKVREAIKYREQGPAKREESLLQE